MMDGEVYNRAKRLYKIMDGYPNDNAPWDVIFHASPSVCALFALLSRCLTDAMKDA